MFDMPQDRSGALLPGSVMNAVVSLYPIRIGTRYDPPNGKDLAFFCSSEQGIFFCKEDRNGRPTRAIEWFFTKLAAYLGIAVPQCGILEDSDRQSFFGSSGSLSTADEFTVRRYLSTPVMNELAQPDSWLGRYLSTLYAFDLFINNPDRCIRNFILQRNGASLRLCAIDFVEGEIADLTNELRFPIAASSTVCDGRFIRSAHPFSAEAALEMVHRIGHVPADVIKAILAEMPDDWLDEDRRGWISDMWSNKLFEARLSKLRAGIEDGSLL